MVKKCRFIDEYASFKKWEILHKFPLMKDEIKKETVSRIDKIVKAYKHGYITIDETMREISEA